MFWYIQVYIESDKFKHAHFYKPDLFSPFSTLCYNTKVVEG